jgi:hypothetical protein
MNAIATRYIERVPCAAKDWEDRRRIPFIIQVAKDYNVQGALVIQQEFCEPHELDIPAIRKFLESNGIPTYFLEFDISAPLGNETFRYMTDAEPPWSFLRLWRYLEEYGGVSIGSIYSHSLIGMWEDQEDGSLGPRKPPPAERHSP